MNISFFSMATDVNSTTHGTHVDFNLEFGIGLENRYIYPMNILSVTGAKGKNKSTHHVFFFFAFIFVMFVHDFLNMQTEKIENYSINEKETKCRTEVNKILNDSDIYFCYDSNNSFHSFCPCSLHNLPR